MRPATLARLALAGSRTAGLRVSLTAGGAALATVVLLAAATVAAVPGDRSTDHARYRVELLREPGMHPEVVLALLAISVPMLALLAQCTRLGAPARDRRLAAIRLAGATPGQAIAIAAGEAAVAATAGTVLGHAGYLIAHATAGWPDRTGRLALPTDVWPSAQAFAAIGVGLPIVVALASTLVLRRVTTTPLSVLRRIRPTHRPHLWPMLLITAVAGVLTVTPVTLPWIPWSYPGGTRRDLLQTAVLSSWLLYLSTAVALLPAWFAHQAGRLLNRFARHPATLLAAARLNDDPWQASRRYGVLTATAMIGAGAAGLHTYYTTAQAVFRPYTDTAHDAELANITLIAGGCLALCAVITAFSQLAAIADDIVTRRRAYASLTAAGVPRRVLGATHAWSTLAGTVPALAVAIAAGASLPRLYLGTSLPMPQLPGRPESGRPAVPIPWANLTLILLGTLAAIAVSLAVALTYLPASTSTDELRTT